MKHGNMKYCEEKLRIDLLDWQNGDREYKYFPIFYL